ncbi:MAG TPA: efflux RND transporter periplasmic adaptor subunit [Spirochaetota bacterium]|nr:efflux RND transporter periplasmic adaptor subunit [Spirochaetota bacterium]HPI21886.1 efflux RND transporter periplasmic adaptor subunit [Spirochaetota bacterium]HPU87208.1 efflux RND transporter periplasmic adaptor subunit [Spirochaetota bacterium]
MKMKGMHAVFRFLAARKKVVFAAMLAVMAAGTAATVFQGQMAERLLSRKTVERDAAPEIATAVIARRDMEHRLSVMGTVAQRDKAAISSKVLGRVERLFAEQGDAVRRGQPLARIETLPLEMQLKSARAELAAVEAARRLVKEKLDRAGRDVERHMATIRKTVIDGRDKYVSFENMRSVMRKKEELHLVGGVSDAELDSVKTTYNSYLAKLLSAKKDHEILRVGYRDADLMKAGLPVPKDPKEKHALLTKLNTKVERAELDAAEQAVKKTETSIEILQTSIKEAVIRSPIDGIVAARSVELGERVKDETTLFVVMNTRQVYVVANVNEKQVAGVRKNQPVAFTVDAVADTPFAGRVHLVSPVLDVATRTVEVKILADNRTGQLRPGMFARAVITMEVLKGIVTVPKEALKDVKDGDGEVFIVKDGAVFRKKIVLGREFEDSFEVKSGLAEGDVVASGGVKMLIDGMKVTEKKNADATK